MDRPSLAARPFVGGDPKQTYEPGRVCSFPLCKTRLSIYNPGDRCNTHPRSKVMKVQR